MKSFENEADPRVVADIHVPDQFYTAFVNTLVVQAGDTHEVWIKFGKKNWQIAHGNLDQMNAKKDRISRFIRDPFAPAPSSLEEFVEMVKNI